MTLLQARGTKPVLSAALFLCGVLCLVPYGFTNNIPVGDPTFGPILVLNPSFETLPSGGLNQTCPGQNCKFRFGRIPGWNVPAGTRNSGQMRPSISGNLRLFDTFAPNNGEIIAFSNGPTISQTVSQTVQLGVPYVFTVDLGQRRFPTAFEASADILLSGHHHPITIMAMGTPPVRGHWSTFTATFTGSPATAGDTITIQLNSHGPQASFDSVTLTAVPEPGTLLLFGSALLLLVLIVSRKQLRRRDGLTDVA